MSVFIILVDWWSSYGGRTIDLQRFAKRIVSLCASSSGCERNWSTFEFVSQLVKQYLCLFNDDFSKLFTYFICCLYFVDPYEEKEQATMEKVE